MKKYEVVTGMTVGQVIDAWLKREDFYCREKKLSLLLDSTGVNIGLDYACMDFMSLKQELEAGNITRLIEIPWTDQLDGTWENGVWCMCWDDGKESAFEKVVDTIYVTDFETSLTTYQNATPLPQDLADKLEALSKEKTK